ncbi:MAG: nodulation protein NfeD, partial [Anaerolineae bacterium]|nr:nodulation protein NfeD [Anaerolineae bacterium]
MKRIKKLLFILLTALFLSQTAAHAQDGLSTIMTMTIDGAIAPASQQYLERAVNVAERQNAEMLILQLNTPGGSIDTMNEMLQIIRGSHIPIIVYVSPKGAMAGSAGTIITLAGHASAMAPETIIGAASPINSDGTDIDDTAKAKATEALK